MGGVSRRVGTCWLSLITSRCSPARFQWHGPDPAVACLMFPSGWHSAAPEVQDLQGSPGNCQKTGWSTSPPFIFNRLTGFAVASTTQAVKKTSSFLSGFLAMLFAVGLLSSAGTAQAALLTVAGTITVDADYGDSFKLGDTSLPSPNPAPGPPQRCSSAVQVSFAGASNPYFPALWPSRIALSGAFCTEQIPSMTKHRDL